MTESKFNRDMLLLARDVKELTQEDLAQASGISQALISKAEHGLLEPSAEALEKIASAVDLPLSFFFQQDRRIGLPHFHARRRAKVPAKSLARIEAIINIRRQHVAKLLRSYEFSISKPIPQIDLDEQGLTPDRVAARLREYWLIPRGPVASVTEIIEEAGGIVIHSRFGTDLLDGLSIRSDGLPPMFFMNRDLAGDRFKFSLARELGHIVMHSIPDDDEKMEHQAYRFAAAFLMPAEDIRPYLADAKITNLARVKAYWNVPIKNLIERAYSLKLMTDHQYRNITAQYNRTCKEVEPIDIPLEAPSSLKTMVQFHLTKLGYSITDLAVLLSVKEEYVRQAYLDRPRLRLVTSNDA